MVRAGTGYLIKTPLKSGSQRPGNVVTLGARNKWILTYIFGTTLFFEFLDNFPSVCNSLGVDFQLDSASTPPFPIISFQEKVKRNSLQEGTDLEFRGPRGKTTPPGKYEI